MPDKKKSPEFVVTDRRKFTSEGELREETTPPEAPAAPPPMASPATPASAATPATPTAVASPSATASVPEPPAAPDDIPPPPSPDEQRASQDAYQGRRLEVPDASGQGRTHDYQMTFERLVASLYMTAMVQMGLIREEGAEPLADLVGAQQTIDTIGLLAEKTSGNLTDAEVGLLQNSLYELRMAFVEITNALARPPQPPGGGPR